MKTCCGCKQSKPETEFWKNRSNRDGLQTYCNSCRSSYDKTWRDQKNPESAKSSSLKYRNGSKGKKRRSDYYSKNKIQINENKKDRYHRFCDKHAHYQNSLKWRKENPDKWRMMQRKYSSKPEAIAKRREWFVANRERLAKKGREASARWMRSHRAYRVSNQQKRVARLAGVENNYTVTDWQDTLLRFGNMCVYCGAQENIVRDHFIPIAKKGGNIKSNVVPACRRCNSSKKQSDPEIWVVNRHGIDKYNQIAEKLNGTI